MRDRLWDRWAARFQWLPALLGLAVVTPVAVSAGEPVGRSDAIRAAIVKAIPLLEAGARGSMQERSQCFTCHNQGVPIVALTAARARGFSIDDAHLQEELEFTAGFLNDNKSKYLQGKGTGGQADTAGYALLALEHGNWRPDETTAAVSEYLLLYQKERDHWRAAGTTRPPTQKSPFTTSYLALSGLKAFGTPDQRERIDRRFEQVARWLKQAAPTDTEDHVFRLAGLRLVGASAEERRRACEGLVATQRADGGWAQLAEMESDAYATATVLVALCESGGMPTDNPVYERGLDYLLSNQLDDGSWHVVTRAKPIQVYYESGYPHGKDQFISIAAAGWATTAFALTLPVVERDNVRPRSPEPPQDR